MDATTTQTQGSVTAQQDASAPGVQGVYGVQAKRRIHIAEPLVYIIGGAIAIVAGLVWTELRNWVWLGFIGLHWVFPVAGGIMILWGLVAFFMWFKQRKSPQMDVTQSQSQSQGQGPVYSSSSSIPSTGESQPQDQQTNQFTGESGAKPENPFMS